MNRRHLQLSFRVRYAGCCFGAWCLSALALGCDLPGKPQPADRPVAQNEVLGFEALYQQNCAGCHGADGLLGPAPPLNNPLFLAIVPDAELARVITDGRPGTPMPAFDQSRGGPLTAAQVQALAQGIKPRWGAPGPSNAQVPPYLRPQTAEKAPAGQQHQGAEVFVRACATCHGSHGQGVKKGGERVRTINDPAFLALISDQALRRLAITGRPDLGMPSYDQPRPGVADFKPLMPEEITQLAAYLASWRQAPPAGGKDGS